VEIDMARPKGAKNKKKHVFQDPQIEEIVEIEVEFICPKRGKVKQKVKVKKLKPIKVDGVQQVTAKDEIDKIDKEDDSLSMYGDQED
jgi:hypothetical protein